MRSRFRVVRVALAWLTAVMVVIGGAPHIACACSICDAAPAETTPLSCCCSGGEGAARNAQDGPRLTKSCCCCCAAPDEPTAKPDQDGFQLKAPLCLKRSAPPDVFVRGQSRVEVQPDHGALILPAPDAPLPKFAGKTDRVVWNTNLAPPPTDLVIILQHFLI